MAGISPLLPTKTTAWLALLERQLEEARITNDNLGYVTLTKCLSDQQLQDALLVWRPSSSSRHNPAASGNARIECGDATRGDELGRDREKDRQRERETPIMAITTERSETGHKNASLRASGCRVTGQRVH